MPAKKKNTKKIKPKLPKGFNDYHELLKKGKTPIDLGFRKNNKSSIQKKVNEFVYRFRLAKSFQGIEVENYSDKSGTVEGYSGLIQNFLTFSAYESFKRMSKTGDNRPLLTENIKKELHSIAEQIRKIMNDSKSEKFVEYLKNNLIDESDIKLNRLLWAFKKKGMLDSAKISDLEKIQKDLKKHFEEKLKKEKSKDKLDSFLKGKDEHLFELASALRHIFAHGILTPNTNGMNPKKLYEVCNLLSNAILKVLEKEFQKNVNASK